jgi:hypothetical protein
MTGQPIPSPAPQAHPSVLVDSGPRAAARGILLWLTGQDDADPEDRITALEALCALEEHLPADVVLAAAEERAGTLQDAQGLLTEAAAGAVPARVLTGISVAQWHLRRRLEETGRGPGGGRADENL